jgi:phytoene synthase
VLNPPALPAQPELVEGRTPTWDRAGLVAHARDTIARGSKSFAAASTLFDPATRERVWLLYAWCRACDDLADDQELGGKLGDEAGADERLATIRRLTAQALAGEATGDPAFDALGVVARETGLTARMAEDVIQGFALDTADWLPRSEMDLLRYCYHVAGAVGVMMAVVMGVAPDDEDTLDRACDLGLAFQLANIARDLCEDYAADRCYLPAEWLAEADIPPGEHMKPHYRAALLPLVRRMTDMAEIYEQASRIGAARLGFRQRWAVLSAAGIYGAIGRKVAAAGAHAWDHRVATSKREKLGFVARALVQAVLPPPRNAAVPALSRREIARYAAGHAAQQRT